MLGSALFVCERSEKALTGAPPLRKRSSRLLASNRISESQWPPIVQWAEADIVLVSQGGVLIK